MRTRFLALSWIACIAIVADPQVARAWIRLQTQDGLCFQQITVGQPVNLFVTYEPTSVPPRPSSISAAEFRLDLGLTNPGAFIMFTPNPAANIVVGTVSEGIHIEFSACQSASPNVLLGTLQVFATAPLTQRSWFVRGGGPGSGICPLVRTCAPESVWLPVYGAEFLVNPIVTPELCGGPFCETIAVEASTWGAIKAVYR